MLGKDFKFSENPIFIGCIAWLLSFFFYSPRFILFLGLNSGTTRRDNILLQCLDPFSRNLMGEEKTQLYSRIVQPTIANFLGWCGERRDLLSILGSPGINYIALIKLIQIRLANFPHKERLYPSYYYFSSSEGNSQCGLSKILNSSGLTHERWASYG